MKNEKIKWIKPELIVFAKGKLGENVLVGCGYTPPASQANPNPSPLPNSGTVG